MKKHYKGILLALSFIAISAILYFIHFLIFGDAHHIFIYLLGDIAFLPIEVLLVSVIFHKIIEDKDKKERFKKINMVLGVYFTEAGVELMQFFSKADNHLQDFRDSLLIKPQWTSKDYKKAIKYIQGLKHHLQFNGPCLISLSEFLTSKRDLFLKLLENPILVEHETFTDLIMALTHAEQELSSRKDLSALQDNDYQHLMNDIERAYHLLLLEWLIYMMHLQKAYPFLYSFYLRTNPYDPHAAVEIQ
ncbi:hypothetical protein [Acetobacterium woodii]|uniref:Putative membrane protein n=1 Tax=Acetobacterium woodii (strain ATCC 29683 / DSM 1030 / JCM 2381 / KCTC 1655 / WB1) TaxID=931626 RepID=H6LIR4_ACEWD|nr:hypothetical protein [Acetobacterium woodii]AFA49803.1 putative membrane protein [Acetobacterium woodii DSM 1030]